MQSAYRADTERIQRGYRAVLAKTRLGLLGGRSPLQPAAAPRQVAAAAAACGAHIVNDVSAGSLDAAMPAAVAGTQCAVALGHMRGDPGSMQRPENTAYGAFRPRRPRALAT